ncbi:hypothetical protein BDQ12DRAFT_135210 [Crucibulum laeve]|uniref:Transmembrane protein n=1 Tax=Crucibulum laeve TaxID=68775 RepID=A0A5C3M030_9AGAR|nr:hypothetical protein BDQ12DRAFT_135210 [Crucibulum laeve]
MPDWSSPVELMKEADVFTKFMHALLGLYAYEWFLSLDFDWDFVTGKKKFRWPMIFYFANRYLLLFAMIGIAIALDTTDEINCQTLYTFNQIAGDAAVGLASINLSIRTMAIWSQNRYIIGFLVLLMLGHWSLILQGVQLTATWVPGAGCVITKTNNTILAAIFIYSMCFDLTVLALNTYKLLGSSTKSGYGASRLAHMIFSDGLIFFIIAFLANLIATVFMLMNLNQLMSVIFNVPAAVFSTIVACRAVRRLTNFTNQGPEIYGASSAHSANVQFRGAPATSISARGLPTISSFKHAPKSGVHVQMETFTHAEDGNDYANGRKQTHDGSETDVELDIEAKGAAL